MKLFTAVAIILALAIPLIADEPPARSDNKNTDIKLSVRDLEKLRIKREVKTLTACAKLDLDEEQYAYFYEIYTSLLPRRQLLILVDKKNNIGPDYKPSNLENVNGTYKLQAQAAQALKEMTQSAKEDGISIYPVSAYRSYNYQKNLFERRAREAGQEYAERYIARAGASQHQLGTAVDLNSTKLSFENTKEFKWLSKNAGRFGFSLSFPKDAQEITGYSYEPWHYRYIGKEAVKMQDKFFGGSQQRTLEFLKKCAFAVK